MFSVVYTALAMERTTTWVSSPSSSVPRTSRSSRLMACGRSSSFLLTREWPKLLARALNWAIRSLSGWSCTRYTNGWAPPFFNPATQVATRLLASSMNSSISQLASFMIFS